MVAEGLYAWSDEGKEVSVRDLAMSLALPERRVRVVLSVLEAMGVAKEIKAARWQGVEPKPTREQVDKAASIFEARRISDRRRLASLLGYMNTQRCRVQMLRAYFGEPEGEKCGLCDSCAGLDSEVFDLKADDQRTGLHAATDFHARPRRRRRGRGGMELPAPKHTQTPAVARAPAFVTQIPSDLLPPLAPYELPAPPERERELDASVWASAHDGTEAGPLLQSLPGDPLHDDADAWLAEIMSAPPPEDARAPVNGVEALAASSEGDAALAGAPESSPAGEDGASGARYLPAWTAVRDANIRPYADWRLVPPVSLPVMQVRTQPQNGYGQQGQRPRPPQQHGQHDQRRHGAQGASGGNDRGGSDRGGSDRGGNDRGGNDRGGRRRKRRGPDRQNNRPNRDRGPRLPGFYNPGGD